MEQAVKKISMYVFITMIIVALIFVFGFFSGTKVDDGFVGGGADYKNASSTVYSNVAGKAVVLSPSNSGRGWATVTNMTATAAYLSLYATTSPNAAPILADTEYTILVPASSMYTFNEDNRWTGYIIASSSAACTFRFTEVY